MIHNDFDLSYFKNLFPINKLRLEEKNELSEPGGEIVTSPYHIAIIEQLRSEALLGRSAPRSIPTDVFVFAEGEPDNRAATKVGGLPFWPKDKEWPLSYFDVPLTFVAQVCISDSKDIVPDAPAELLVILADQYEFLDNPRNKSALQFYWFHLSDQELLGGDSIPESEWKIPPRYGVRHRTVDFTEFVPEFRKYSQPDLISKIVGTKIGGAPRWIQCDPELPGKFLATVGSIVPVAGIVYPFVNHPEPLDYSNASEELMWNDAGSLYLSTTTDGSVHWEVQGY